MATEVLPTMHHTTHITAALSETMYNTQCMYASTILHTILYTYIHSMKEELRSIEWHINICMHWVIVCTCFTNLPPNKMLTAPVSYECTEYM